MIHPPDKRVESYDEKGKPVTSFELDKTTFLEVSGDVIAKRKRNQRRCWCPGVLVFWCPGCR